MVVVPYGVWVWIGCVLCGFVVSVICIFGLDGFSIVLVIFDCVNSVVCIL